MYEYEKSFTAVVFGLAVFAVFQLAKTIFYRLPCAVCRLLTKNN